MGHGHRDVQEASPPQPPSPVRRGGRGEKPRDLNDRQALLLPLSVQERGPGGDGCGPLPPLPPPPARQQAIRRRAGDAFEEAHRSRTRVLLFTRYALGVTLAGAAAIYLLWALKIARTFG